MVCFMSSPLVWSVEASAPIKGGSAHRMLHLDFQHQQTTTGSVVANCADMLCFVFKCYCKVFYDDS